MAKEFTQKIIGTVQSGLNTTVQSLQAAVQPQLMGSSFYPTTLDQMESQKSGWLRKQGGVVKSWHRRYFIMKGDYIYYYSSDDDLVLGKPPLGSIFLPGNRVAEIPFSPSDVEKFQFEIQSGDNTRISPTHETFLLSAETEEERKEWIRVIKQFLYSACGGAIFGQSLERTMDYERKVNKSSKIPHIVVCCIDFLTKHGLKEEGIFRLPGRSVVIRELQEMFDRGERPSFTPGDPPSVKLDVHTVASLLKLYLRELPEPLIPFAMYEQVMMIVGRELPVIGEEKAAAKLGELLGTRLSPANYNTLQYVCQFLAEVAVHSNDNKMTAKNLATVFVPCILSPDVLDDPALILATSNSRTSAALVMLTHHRKVFSIEYTAEGSAIITADILGLNSRSSRCSVVHSQPAQLSVATASLDLMGLDLSPQPIFRESSLMRTRTERLSDNRAGIMKDVKAWRDDVMSQENCSSELTNGSATVRPMSMTKPPVSEKPNRRTVRSSSFDGKMLPAPVPPPKPNRQRAMMMWRSQLDELAAKMRIVEDERDVALAQVQTLQSKLEAYREQFGPLPE